MSVTLKQVAKYIPSLWSANIVPFLHSSPAIGKSSVAKQLAQEYSLEVIDLRLTELDPSDMNGLPTFEEHKATFKPFDTFPLESTKIPKGKNGWLLLLDEFNSANPLVQAAAYKLILDRKVGQYNLHSKVAIIACGNLETDNAIVNPMSSALISRFAHFYIDLNNDDWIDWASKNNINPKIISYISFKPSSLYTFNPDSSKPYASPRTWEMLSKVMDKTNEVDIPLCASLIGEGVALEFTQYLKIFESLVSIEDILNSPNKAPVPQELSVKWATMTMVLGHINEDNYSKILDYIERFPSELQLVFIKQLKNNFKLLNLAKDHSVIVNLMRLLHD